MSEANYLRKILSGNNENHILPFLWLREQTEETLRTEIEKIYDCGIRAVCLESRPHPDFGGDGWWHDFDIVIEEAKKRDMKIWILDDAHFPTGMANGLIPSKYPELARKYIMTQFVDCAGPVVAANLDVNLMMTKQFKWTDFGKRIDTPLIDRQELLSVTAFKVVHGDVISSESIDLTEHVENGWLTWDVPDGVWRICVSFTTYDFGANNDYINYIDKKSVHTLIEAVYELHYDHYKDEFGKTIAGFFSDEPGFYNVADYKMYCTIGRTPGMALPWSEELREVYENNKRDWKTSLPYLWLDSDDETLPADLRRYYMDQVTRLYAEDFSCQLGQWCKEHGVEYIGHVVEDYDSHMKLGTGTGHYFRAMEGQAWAGIDVIGGQILPGNSISTRHGVTADGNAEFYHYMLAPMGASAAAIDPAKKGRLMCEMYGAYGWNFGVKSMKWLTDFLLFQGVNKIVPHAFSMADYPDIDCPPHFYARGNNGQYPYFAELMKYANRICDLLGDSKNVPQVGVIYGAEKDWMNESMKIQDVGKELLTNQIAYQILPTDIFEARDRYKVTLENGRLSVNEREMKALVVTETRFIEERELAVLKEAAAAGLPVYFLGKFPEYAIGDGTRRQVKMAELKGIKELELDALAAELKAKGIVDIAADAYTPDLLATHYRKDGDIYCLFNTNLAYTIDVNVTLPVAGKLAAYDGMKNALVSVDNIATTADGRTKLHLTLAPYQSLVLLANLEGLEDADILDAETASSSAELDISDNWNLAAVRSINYPNFPAVVSVEKLEAYSRKNPEFAGILRYEKTLSLTEVDKNARFEAQHIYEVAEVFVNGESAGKKITPPYSWKIGNLLKAGENTIRVEVANTPTRDTLHVPSPFGPDRAIIEPSGMFGKIVIK